MQVFTRTSFWVSLVFFSMIFSALFGLEAGFTELFKLARVISNAGSSVFDHLKYFCTGQVAQSGVDQEITFPGIQTLDDVKCEQGVVSFVIITRS